MANEYTVNAADLTAVADAIRAKTGTSEGLSFPDGFAAAIAGISTGAQVASGSVELYKKNKMNINPGFAVRNVCFALPKSPSTDDYHRGGGIYIDGTASGDITSVKNIQVLDQYQTNITLNHSISGTVYWLATS